MAAEGEPEAEFNPGIAGRLPRKTAAGGALIRDRGGRILFLEPTYKPTLDIPGGIVEENESPYEACRREVKEEIGLDLEIGPLLVVDWIPAAGPWPDALAFVFDGGILDHDALDHDALARAAADPTEPHADPAALTLDPTEARAYHYLTLAEATPRLRPSMARRLALAERALTTGISVYADFGRS
ncbi:NUDIX hydrolase [Kribbella hippodromi]|uniref:NUDIX hydrolase n=1 Tax=Kribbella hippodromi TaxID=434347 RepID=A0ABN2E593_9ACTN